jgi:N-methylhydantoinase B
MYVGGFDPEKQARFVGHRGPDGAGWSSPTKDGIGVVETDLNTIRYPIEACEAELPLRVRALGLWTDSGGAAGTKGRWATGRGGVARGDALVTLRQERHKIHPWGLLGGSTAPTCRSVLRRADGHEEELAAKQVITVRAGDRILMWITGGGGYGSPFDREPRAVLDDVLDGRVSRDAATAAYGVVLQGDVIDEAATRARRAALRVRPSDT